jgi:hypothetical protein
MVRVTTTSRCDFRSTVVRFFAERGLLSILAFIALLLSCQFLDNPVQLVEACAQRWRYLSSHAISSSNRRGPSWYVRTRPIFLVVTSPACSRTPTCSFVGERGER